MPEKLGPVKFLSLHTYKNMVCKYFFADFQFILGDFKNIYREEIDDYSVKSFLVRFHFKRQFLNLEYRGKKNIIFVFPVLGFFMVKLSFEF